LTTLTSRNEINIEIIIIIIIIIIFIFNCPWYFIPKGEEINKGIIMLWMRLGWSENWAGGFPNELQKQTELKR